MSQATAFVGLGIYVRKIAAISSNTTTGDLLCVFGYDAQRQPAGQAHPSFRQVRLQAHAVGFDLIKRPSEKQHKSWHVSARRQTA